MERGKHEGGESTHTITLSQHLLWGKQACLTSFPAFRGNYCSPRGNTETWRILCEVTPLVRGRALPLPEGSSAFRLWLLTPSLVIRGQRERQRRQEKGLILSDSVSPPPGKKGPEMLGGPAVGRPNPVAVSP